LAGGLDAIVGLVSVSFASATGGGRNNGAASADAALGFRTGAGAGADADASADAAPNFRTGAAVTGLPGASGEACAAFSVDAAARSSSVRLSALSIAVIAAETGSDAEFCFVMMSASPDRRRSSGSTDAPNAFRRRGFEEPAETIH
jgi:hypothetical protein